MLIASQMTIGMMEIKPSDISDGASSDFAATRMDVAADAQVNLFRSVCIVQKINDDRSHMTKHDRFFVPSSGQFGAFMIKDRHENSREPQVR
jgi:hypothetical protein